MDLLVVGVTKGNINGIPTEFWQGYNLTVGSRRYVLIGWSHLGGVDVQLG